MAKTTSTSTASTASATTKAAKVTKPKAAKAAKPAKEAKVAAVPETTVTTEAASPSPAVVETVNFDNEFASLLANLQNLTSVISTLRAEARSLEKKVAREMKIVAKVNSKKAKSSNRAPSGFVMPTMISNELAEFLQKPVGTEMARTEVTKEINAYIRDKDLKNKENGRIIHPDPALSKLLGLTASDELTYFNLQKFMSPHFAKASAKASATAGA